MAHRHCKRPYQFPLYNPLTSNQAGIIVSIQVQLLTSSSPSSSALTRIFLTLGITSELLGVMLIVFFTRFSKYQSRELPGSAAYRVGIRIASELPAFFVLVGIVGVAAALVVETLDVSVGVAVAMSGVLILLIIFCFVVWCLEVGGRVVLLC
jgi:hypothetical protein